MDSETYEQLKLLTQRICRSDQKNLPLSEAEIGRLVRRALKERIPLTDVEDYLDYRDNLV